jgi:hypothetical protein
MKKLKTLALPLERFTTGTIIDNNNATVATITLCSTEGTDGIQLYIEQPSDRHYLYFVLTNGTLEVRITLLQTLMYCTCVQLRELYRYQQLRILLMRSNEL